MCKLDLSRSILCTLYTAYQNLCCFIDLNNSDLFCCWCWNEKWKWIYSTYFTLISVFFSISCEKYLKFKKKKNCKNDNEVDTFLVTSRLAKNSFLIPYGRWKVWQKGIISLFYLIRINKFLLKQQLDSIFFSFWVFKKTNNYFEDKTRFIFIYLFKFFWFFMTWQLATTILATIFFVISKLEIFSWKFHNFTF